MKSSRKIQTVWDDKFSIFLISKKLMPGKLLEISCYFYFYFIDNSIVIMKGRDSKFWTCYSWKHQESWVTRLWTKLDVKSISLLNLKLPKWPLALSQLVLLDVKP